MRKPNLYLDHSHYVGGSDLGVQHGDIQKRNGTLPRRSRAQESSETASLNKVPNTFTDGSDVF